MTAWPSVEDAVNSFKSYKGVDYLQKPMLTHIILNAVKEAVEWSVPKLIAQEVLSIFSARELDVLRLLSKGLPIKQIAFQLNLSPKTIEYHRSGIKDKLGSGDITRLFELCKTIDDINKH